MFAGRSNFFGREQIGPFIHGGIHDERPNIFGAVRAARRFAQLMNGLIVTGPDAKRHIRRIADKPSVAVILRRTGFADNRHLLVMLEFARQIVSRTGCNDRAHHIRH